MLNAEELQLAKGTPFLANLEDIQVWNSLPNSVSIAHLEHFDLNRLKAAQNRMMDGISSKEKITRMDNPL